MPSRAVVDRLVRDLRLGWAFGWGFTFSMSEMASSNFKG